MKTRIFRSVFLCALLLGPIQSAMAIECPQQTLDCTLSQVSVEGRPVIIGRETETFRGINTDEPSLPPNECILILQLRDQSEMTYNVTVKDDLQTFLHIGATNEYGARDPQASFYPTLGKPFSLYFGVRTLTCELK